MGTHGGGTTEGNLETARNRGIDFGWVGAEVIGDLATTHLHTVDGFEVQVGRAALSCDGVMLVNPTSSVTWYCPISNPITMVTSRVTAARTMPPKSFMSPRNRAWDIADSTREHEALGNSLKICWMIQFSNRRKSSSSAAWLALASAQAHAGQSPVVISTLILETG
jgi:hypothetical protein